MGISGKVSIQQTIIGIPISVSTVLVSTVGLDLELSAIWHGFWRGLALGKFVCTHDLWVDANHRRNT
jgi:hypothetical protein